MLCHFFRRRKKEDFDSSLTKKHDEVTVTNSDDFKLFSHSLSLMHKDFDSVFSAIGKCLKLSISQEMKLKTNSPYMPSILRNFNIKIVSILKYYERNMFELSENHYFRVLIWTLVKQCKEIIDIFRKSAKLAFIDEFSLARQKIIYHSFLLSHLFQSLVALFPNNFYAPESFRITKADAADWWHSHFGLSTTVVKWKDFFNVFSKSNDLSDLSQMKALKKTINITGSGFVSIFDFDVFVRLFQPWNNILETWRILVLEHPGYMSLLTYEQVIHILQAFKYCPGAGSYIFRFSCTKPGQWAIGHVDASGKVLQTIVHNKSLAVALYEGEQSGIYKYPNGVKFDSSILQSLTALPPQNIIVTEEEHEAYHRIDSSFEVCKICALNEKNVRLEPCGHLLCNFCLAKWQKSFRFQCCPFCRLQIKSVEPVSIVPYKNETSLDFPQSSEYGGEQYPVVPARLSNSTSLSPSKMLNYANLDWLSLNDSGCFMYDCMEEQCERTANVADGFTVSSSHFRDGSHTYYLNDAGCSTSSAKHISSDRRVRHDAAILKLLKITNNDLTMSREILRYFTLRSVSRHP